jgi:anti-sigma-K factor RskA
MSDERFLELAPLAALGALDGEDLSAFSQYLAASAPCRDELAAFESVAARLPMALEPVATSAAVREQVMGAAAPHRAAPAPVRSASWLFPALATAAALVLGFGYVRVRGERDVARREAFGAKDGLEALGQELTKAQLEMASLRRELTGAREVRDLVARPGVRVARLTGLQAAPKASARVVWDPGTREAVLLVAGLGAAPTGKAYEVWVIGQAAPAPAGVFQVAADGSAVFRLPDVAETARVKTFAVTLEPQAGTKAPTGPMVLAGAATG